MELLEQKIRNRPMNKNYLRFNKEGLRLPFMLALKVLIGR